MYTKLEILSDSVHFVAQMLQELLKDKGTIVQGPLFNIDFELPVKSQTEIENLEQHLNEEKMFSEMVIFL